MRIGPRYRFAVERGHDQRHRLYPRAGPTTAGSAVALLADARRLAAEGAEVVELRATHAAAAHHLHRRHHRAVHREDALDADAGRDLPHREVLADAAAALGDDETLERLEALLLA